MISGEPPFAIEQISEDGHVTVRVMGGVDMSTVDRFERALEEAFAGSEGAVRLDLGAATFFGSEGVRALLVAQNSPQSGGRTVEIVAASSIARRVLQITGLV